MQTVYIFTLKYPASFKCHYRHGHFPVAVGVVFYHLLPCSVTHRSGIYEGYRLDTP